MKPDLTSPILRIGDGYILLLVWTRTILLEDAQSAIAVAAVDLGFAGHHATVRDIHEKINVEIASGEIVTEAIQQATKGTASHYHP